MSTPAGSPLPTRSKIANWDITHLDQAATRWRALADESERIFGEHSQNVRTPGGTAWKGSAAEAASERVTADMVVVRRQSEAMRQSAEAARTGAGDLRAAQRKALEAIADAEADRFKVGEDLSVNDTQRRDLTTAAARQRVAAEHAEYIRWHAERLIQTDNHVAGRVKAKAVELEGITFEQRGRDGVQLVDNQWSLGNPPPVDPLEEILRKYQVADDPDGARDWEPPWPFSMLTDPKHVTASEARILDELSPAQLRDMNQIKEAAEVEAKVHFPPQNGPNDTADNHTDAFRHAYWNALMTQRFGEQWTRDFTNAHERLPNNPATAEAMDLYNNEVGRNIATANPDATPAQLADLVEQAVKNGDTVVIAPGGERLAWSDTIPWGETGTTTKTSVPGQVPIPTGAGPDGFYDPGQPGGYGTSAGGY